MEKTLYIEGRGMNNQKIAVIGMGMWGKNIVRNFYNLNVLDTVCDIDEENLKKVTEQYPGVKVTKDLATKMAYEFCKTIEDSGYWCLNYSNPDFLKNYFEEKNQ